MIVEGVNLIYGPVTPGVIRTGFYKAMQETADLGVISQLCQPIKMTEYKKIDQSLGSVMALSEFTGTNKVSGITENEYILRTKEYQGGFMYDKYLSKHELWSLITRKNGELAERANNHSLSKLSEVIKANPTGYDGKALFANDHPAGKTVNDNIYTGTGTSLAQITTDFYKVLSRFGAFRDDRGELLHQRTNGGILVYIPPDLHEQFDTLNKAQYIASGTNVIKEKFTIFIDNDLVDANDWYISLTGALKKPLLMNTYMEATLEIYPEPKAPRFINVSAFRIYNIQPGDPTKIIKVTNT